ncbi:MAG: SMP-30/gluconolactonase/LRE family protein [Roseitalea sp.]|jgi:D-xylonolactonase|nr:SMP-30/gluconolactonase/LRE family protein [Roseitalea sp.]MBO6721197.1 SMP-30/gluconolactonase/LRE family protein [Roseitalea sp.]MBO6744255.1 SMP-30/gluconolactonase/LRE family protein [Roseitalea sp.]
MTDAFDQMQVAADFETHCGENPLWDANGRRLFWLDILRPRLFWLDPESGLSDTYFEGEVVGGLTLQADDSQLLFMAGGRIAKLSVGGDPQVVCCVPAERDTRFNDVVADPLGGVFFGAMPTGEHPGAIYRIDPSGACSLVLDDIALPNGMAFSPDHAVFYYVDSRRRRIWRACFDPQSGALSNTHILVENRDADGLPDGLCVDADGYLWSARWDGGCVIRYAPDGTEACRLDVPAQKVTSVTFGGESLDDLYITTAGAAKRPEEGCGAGALFRTRLSGIRGLPEMKSRVLIE